MNSDRKNEISSGPMTAADEALRLIANLPAPDGLADRVQARLSAAPRRARVFEWLLWLGPGAFRYSAAMRGAAAAAIVVIVAGGGWSIYSHVQPLPVSPGITTPARIGNGFSSAGAMRTPDSPNGPVLTHAPTPAAAVPATQKAPALPSHKHAKKHTKAVPVIAQPQ